MVNFSQESEEQYKKVACSKTEISGAPLDVSNRIIIVNDATRPNHYGGKNSTYEVFKVLEAWGLDKDFYLGNVIKYLARAGKKSKTTEKEDLQKALVYLQRRIDTL
jgi:hypothetical protein